MSSAERTTDGRPDVARRSVFWPAVWLGVALVVTKAIYLEEPPRESWAEFWEHVRYLAAVSYQDLVFVGVLAIVAQIGLWVSGRRPRVQRAIFGGFVAVGVVSVAYGFVNAYTLDYFGRPLTLSILSLLSQFRLLRSSLVEELTPLNVTGLIGLPLVYLTAVVTALRLGRRRARVRWKALAVMLVGSWMVFGLRVQAVDPPKYETGLAESPHIVLLQSGLALLPGSSVVLPADEWQPGDERVFQPFSARPAASTAADTAADTSAAIRPRGRIKNVIQIVLESTSAKYLTPYGSPYNTTPRLAAEAEHSLVFDNVYAHLGYTFLSAITLTYGVYPGLPWNWMPNSEPIAGPTLAERLSALDYRTVYMTSGDLQWEGIYTLMEGRGFDDEWDFRRFDCSEISSWGTEDRCMFDGLLEWIDLAPERPFFVVGWTDQTHSPYVASPGVPTVDFLTVNDRRDDEFNRYLNILRTVDEQLGRLFDGLRARGLDQNTLVVITGDHGEAFGSPHGMRGHGYALWDELIRVPMIFWSPALFPEGGRSDTVGGHVDLHATIADLLGIAPSGQWQGFSLFDPTRPPRAYFLKGCEGCDDYELGVRENSWKYTLNVTRGRERLFDMSQDPEESRNVADTEPEVTARLRQRLAAWVAFEIEYVPKLSPIE